jgi:hypothetical protein
MLHLKKKILHEERLVCSHGQKISLYIQDLLYDDYSYVEIEYSNCLMMLQQSM